MPTIVAFDGTRSARPDAPESTATMPTASLASARRLLDAGHLVGAALLFAALVAGGAATTASLVSAGVGDSLDGPPIAAPAIESMHRVAMGPEPVGRAD